MTTERWSGSHLYSSELHFSGALFALHQFIECVVAFSLRLLDRVTKPLCKSFTSDCHRVFTMKQRSERIVHAFYIHQPLAARSKCTS